MNSTMRRTAVGTFALLAGMVSTAPAASYAQLLAKAEASKARAVNSGKRLAPAGEVENPYTPRAVDVRQGFIIYVPPIEQPFRGRPPASGEVRDAVEVRAAQGETESFLLGVHALKPRQGLSWSVRGPSPRGIRFEFLPVVMAPMARRRSNEYRIAGLWLAEGGAVDIEAGQSRAWLVRLYVAEDARPGSYSIRPWLAPKGGRSSRVGPTVRIRVLPFKLADPWERKYVFGAFCAGANFNDAQYAQMKAHGIETILWFWGHYGLNVLNEDGKLRMDFTDLDATVSRFQKAGLRGPIALALGNDCCGHFERAICRRFSLPMQPRVDRRGKTVQVAVLDNPRIEELMIEALRQLFEHAKAKKWPELVILPYDEPTERLMDEHRRMVRIFRKHFPDVRLYGVTMNRLSWAVKVGDTDILVANGDWARIRKFATERKKAAWFYGGATTAQGYAGCRWRYGLQPYAYGPDGVWFWCYNFHLGDPWNEFDGRTSDSSWVICWPRLKKEGASVGTLAYEGLREAVDDVRYAMTLEAKLARVGRTGAGQALRAAYEKWREGLRGRRRSPSQIVKNRDQLIKWILAIR